MAGEALNPSADKETPKKPLPHPPPARARPTSPLRRLRGEVGRTARCPPPRPRGVRLPCNTKRTKAEYSGLSLSPTRPPLAPVRPRPFAEAPGRDRPDSSLPPAPPAGGEITLQNQSTRIAEYCSKVRSRAVLQTARSLITIRSIESLESPSLREHYAGAPSLEAPSLRCSSLGASSLVAPMLRASSLGDSMPSISLPTENSIPCKTQALE